MVFADPPALWRQRKVTQLLPLTMFPPSVVNLPSSEPSGTGGGLGAGRRTTLVPGGPGLGDDLQFPGGVGEADVPLDPQPGDLLSGVEDRLVQVVGHVDVADSQVGALRHRCLQPAARILLVVGVLPVDIRLVDRRLGLNCVYCRSTAM
jgi:hypothetical protein